MQTQRLLAPDILQSDDIPSKTAAFAALKNCIRWGEASDQPQCLQYLVLLADQLCVAEPRTAKRQCYRELFRLLLETLCDVSVARHWRIQCLDHLYYPLFRLRRLAQTPADQRELRQLYSEMKTLSAYFL